MRILGIDIGTHSIKAVELESAFGKYEVHDYYERVLGPEDHPYEAIRDLVHSLPKRPDRFAVSLSTAQTTFRNIDLPTRDKKAIQSSLVFELEDELPFEIDEITYHYSITSQQNTHSRIHVAAVKNQTLEETLNAWQAADVDPDILTTEAWAFRTLIARSKGKIPQDEPVMIVHIGERRTVISVHLNGAPIVCREFPWGGRQITDAISKKYDISLEKAESSKVDHGFVLTDAQLEQATAEQAEYSEMITDVLQSLTREIRQSELTCKNVSKRNVSRVYLSGATALLPGLDKKIKEEVGITTRTLKAFSKVSSSGVAYSEATEVSFPLALGLALTAISQERSQVINLRRGPYSKKAKAMTLNFSAVKGPLYAAAAIILSFFISLVVQSAVYRSQIADMDRRLNQSIRAFIGPVSSSAIRTYTSNSATLRAKIESELQTLREQAQLMGQNPQSPMNFLRNLSSSIPESVIVDMTEFQVGASPEKPYSEQEQKHVSLTFLFERQDDIARVKDILAGQMETLEQSAPEQVTVPDKNETRWKVTYRGTPKESAYGK